MEVNVFMFDFNLSVFLLGCLGGLLPDVLRIVKEKDKTSVSINFKKTHYWLGLAFQIILGGLVVLIFKKTEIVDILIYGYSAPQIITKLVSSATADDKKQPAANNGLDQQMQNTQTFINVDDSKDESSSDKFSIKTWWAK